MTQDQVTGTSNFRYRYLSSEGLCQKGNLASSTCPLRGKVRGTSDPVKKGVSSEGHVMSEKIFYFGMAVVSLRRASVAEPEPVGAEVF